MPDPAPAQSRTRPPGPPAIVWAMAAVFAGIEGALQLSDAGMLPIEDLRWTVYRYLAFFDLYFEGVLDGKRVPPEFWSSIVTHAFLHGGAIHLVMNGAIFLGIGGLLANLLGTARFLLLFLITAIAGGLLFGLLAETNGPLVGASGALFGFFGALKRWEWRYIQITGTSQQRFWRSIAGLVAINVLLAVVTIGGSSLAWEAHLGGFVAGFLIAPVLAPRLAAQSPI